MSRRNNDEPRVVAAKESDPVSWSKVRDLPPSELDGTVAFESRHSDMLSRFLLICDIIQRSSWYQCEQVQAFRGKGRNRLDVIPEIEKTVLILLYFKQLLANDDILGLACNCYIKFVTDSEKLNYVRGHRRKVTEILKRQPDHPALWEVVADNQQFLQAFCCGSMVSRSRSKDEDVRALNAFRKIFQLKDDRNAIATVLNYLLLNLYFHIAAIAALFALDYEHWLKHYTIARPELGWQENLFAWIDNSGN